MGMFSWNCLACGFSLRECKNCSVDSWMAQGVALSPNGTRVIGWYNSYGQLGDTYNLADQMGDFSVYHKACWELVGKPEFTKQASHAHDQGFCLPTHGNPLPLPTHQWLEKCPMAHAIDRVCHAYSRWAADRRYNEGEAQFLTLSADDQRLCLAAYKADEDARNAAHRAAMDAYYNSDDDNARAPERPEKPELFLFNGVNYYGSVLWVRNRWLEDDELRKNRKSRL